MSRASRVPRRTSSRSQISDWRLVEAPPQCHPIEVPKGARLQQRIEGEVYYTGALGKNRLPKVFAL